MDLVYFILIASGMTQIIISGSIFRKIRPSKEWLRGFGELFHCPICMGFWVGVFLWSINGFTELFNFEYNLINPLLLGSLSSGTSYLLYTIMGDYGIRFEHIANIFDRQGKRWKNEKKKYSRSKTLLQRKHIHAGVSPALTILRRN